MKKTIQLISSLFVVATMSSQNLLQNLQACYPLNGNAENKASTGSILNGTMSSITSTADRYGNANSALWFNGTQGSHVRLPNDVRIKPTNALSFSAWIKIDTNTPDVQYIVFAKNNCSSYFEAYGLALAHKGELPDSGEYKLCCNKFSNPSTLPCPAVGSIMPGHIPLHIGIWYHVGMYVGTDSLKLYVNGVLDTSISLLPPTLQLTYDNTNVYLGGTNESNFPEPFFGSMDNVRFYNQKLSNEEFNVIYNTDPSCDSPATGLLNGLQACYPLDGNVVNQALNACVPNSLNGIANNVIPTIGHTGATNSAYKFSGFPNSYIKLPNDTRIKPTNGLSFSAWSKLDAVNIYQYIVFAKNTCSSYFEGYALLAENAGNGKIRYLVEKTNNSCSASGYADLTSSSLYTANAWNHVAFYIDNNVIKLYVNGILDNSVNSSVIINYDNTNVYLGGTNMWFNYPLNGKIDNVRFYNRELSAGEIYGIKNQNPSCSTIDVCGGSSLPCRQMASANNLSQTNDKSYEIKIYPNPSTSKLYINSEKNKSFTIYDVYGKIVPYNMSQVDEITTEINLIEKREGVYFLKIMDDKGIIIQTAKIIVTQ